MAAKFISVSSVKKTGRRGRSESPLNATFSTLWKQGKEKGFAIDKEYGETHENKSGEQRDHVVSSFALYAWAKRYGIAGSTPTKAMISVSNGETASGDPVLIVTPKAAKK